MERDSHDRNHRRPGAARPPWRHWFLAAALAFLPGLALALGLGPIEVRSHLNEPLDAVIPLTEVRPDEVEDLTVSLAPLDTFQRLGLDITPALRQLRFKVKEDGQGGYFVRVSSLGPIQEPFLTFVVALEWPKGRLLREYTVLLDPPLFTETQAPPAETPIAPAAPQEGPEAMEASPEPAPTVPATEAAAPTGAASAEAREEAPFVYGPVRRGETLSTIAQRVHPPEVTLEQMMIALYQANPEAFYGNINRLKAGSVLRLDEDPRTAAARIDPDSARAEVIRQYQAWRLARGGRGEPALVSTPGEGASAPETRAAGDARLELVVPEEGSADSAGGGGDLAAKVAELERRLALASEAAAAAQKENEHLAQRVAALEEQVAALQRLVALRDEQLARMGAKVPEAAPSGQTQAVAVGEGARSAAPTPPPATLPPQRAPSIWQDPVILSALVGGGSLLLLGGWFLWYRRRTRFEDEEWTQTVLDSADEGPEAPSSTVAGEAKAVAPEPAAAGVPSVPSVPSEPASKTAAPAAAGGEIDPLAEADVYLAYGSYDQARAVIEQALESEPGRLDLLQKRLEIAYNERDVDAFCHYAEAVLDALDGDTDRPEWQRVKAMGEDLVPDHPWFREHTQLLDGSMVGTASEATEAAPSPSETVTDEGREAPESVPLENPDEVTLFAEDSELEAKGSTEAPPPAEAEAEGESGEGLRLQPLAEGDESRPEAVGEKEAPSEVAVSSELDLQPLESVEEDGESPAEGRPDRSAEGSAVAEEEFDGNAFFVFTDEVGTKLDLARAYIEMGDKAGAKELLEEVLEVGDENQRAEAEELLRQIA